MATCILEDTIADNHSLSKEQLIEALAAEIPNPQQAAEFKKSVATLLKAQSTTTLSPELIESSDSVFEQLPPDSEPEVPLPQWDSTFLSHCQQLLSRYIGMMATCILEDTIADNPSLSKEQLIEALAAEIPNPQQAIEFKKKIVIALEAPSIAETPQKSIYSGRKISGQLPQLAAMKSNQPKPVSSFQLTQSFADRCQRELTRCIGPMAKYVVEDTLEQTPQLSVHQLIETLAAEIPNAKQAAEFRQRLLLSLNA